MADEDQAQLSSKKTDKILIELTPGELIEATSAVSARYGVGVRPQTDILASRCASLLSFSLEGKLKGSNYHSLVHAMRLGLWQTHFTY